jgi:hypothetical protein
MLETCLVKITRHGECLTVTAHDRAAPRVFRSLRTLGHGPWRDSAACFGAAPTFS